MKRALWTDKKGFTLVEMVTVIAILGILSGVFYTVLNQNWVVLDTYMTRSDLWYEMDRVFDKATIHGRDARSITVEPLAPACGKTATFKDNTDVAFATYTITAQGELQLLEGIVSSTLSENVIFNTSCFTQVGQSVLIDLTLGSQGIRNNTSIISSVEVFPRNYTQQIQSGS